LKTRGGEISVEWLTGSFFQAVASMGETMSRAISSPCSIALVAFLVLNAGGAAQAATVINACVNKRTGALRIEQMYPDLPKIELFARSRRDGWTSWDNQVT
jgi:hypothetical protein